MNIMSNRRHGGLVVMVLVFGVGVLALGQQKTDTQPAGSTHQVVKLKYKYSNPVDLKIASHHLLPRQYPKHGTMDSDGQPAMRYLSNPDPRMSRMAADILIQSPWTMSSASFTKYLDAKYPIHVRMAALYRSFLSEGTQKEYEAGFDSDKYRQKMKTIWARLYTDILSMPVTPPYFNKIMVQYGRISEDCTEVGLAEAIKAPKDVRLAARRCLQGMDSAKFPGYIAYAMIMGLESPVTLEEIVAWYPLSVSPKARVAVLYVIKELIARKPEYRALCQKLLKIAKKDWDEDAKKAAASLEKTLEHDGGGQ